jgi:acyl-CoA synthetase (AMP-forming)/AMP-acid ligase II
VAAAPDLAAIHAALTAPGAAFEIRQEPVRGVPLPVFARRLRSLRRMIEASARFGDRTYVVDGDTRLSFGDHLEKVRALASLLHERYQVGRGDRVAIFAANRWEWITCFWATLSLGAIPCGFNGWWTADEFAHGAALVEPVLLIGDQPRLDRLTGTAVGCPVLLIDEVGPLTARYAGRVPPEVTDEEDEPALLLFTSGTTGRPKAVSLPHRAVIGFAQMSEMSETEGRIAGGLPQPADVTEVPPSDDVILVTSPLFHVSMLWAGVIMAATRGSSMVLLPGRFDPERVLAAIERERVTMWSALGSAGPRIAQCPALGRYDTSSVSYLGIGGAPVSPSVQRRLRESFPSARALGMGYTSTEGGAVIARIAGPEFIANPTATGRVSPMTELEIRDESGRPVPDGELGEVHIRSAYIMLGYWKDPEASAAVLREDGWLAMRDIGRMNGGLLYLDSRARDLILVSAENVSPTEVEYVLEESPAVSEACVFAVDDELTGDAVCAVVVPVPGFAPTAPELTAWSRQRLAHYKVPTQWHIVTDPLPRTASGKVVKRAVREQVERLAAPAGGD